MEHAYLEEGCGVSRLGIYREVFLRVGLGVFTGTYVPGWVALPERLSSEYRTALPPR